MAVTYAVTRATADVRVEATYANVLEGTSDGLVYMPAATATRNGDMLLLIGGTYWTTGGSTSATIVSASGATMWTGSYNLNLLAAAYMPRNQGEGVTTSAYFPFTFSATNNGEVGIVLHLQDTLVEDTLVDDVSLEAHSGEGAPVYGALADNMTTTDAQVAAYTRDATDGARFIVFDAQAALGTLLADTTNLTPVSSVFPRWGGGVLETISLTAVQALTMKLADVLTDGTALTDPTLPGLLVAATEGLTLTDAVALVSGVSLLEALLLPEAVQPSVRYTQLVAEAWLTSDALRRFLADAIADTVNITRAASVLLRTPDSVTEGVTVAPTLAPSLLLHITSTETVTLDDVDILKAIYAGTVAEQVDIIAGYLQPNGAFTSWAVNTRTAAVSEYTNYEFNSFARLGQRYLGASSTGLYVLDGDDDAGTDIIGDIKTGFAQFAGARYTSLKAIYIGMRGSGEFVLKIEEGDGTLRTYKVLTQNMTTAKVNPGKGIRARYLSFELVSTGQDFDLDTIEMVPLLAQRRV